jgi:hypothetical protein
MRRPLSRSFSRRFSALKEFDDDQLMAMNPTCGDHQQK